MGIHRKGLAAIALTIAFLILTGIFNPHPVYATDPTTNSAQSNLSSPQQEDSLRSATLVYDGDTIDVGKNVFYNTANLEVYQETPFDNLAPGAETSATLGLQFNLLSRAYKNLGVRVLNIDEELDDTWPTGKFHQTELLPKWFEDHVNVRGATGATYDEDNDNNNSNNSNSTDTSNLRVPNTGKAIAIVATASGCTMCITFIIVTATFYYLHHRKK